MREMPGERSMPVQRLRTMEDAIDRAAQGGVTEIVSRPTADVSTESTSSGLPQEPAHIPIDYSL